MRIKKNRYIIIFSFIVLTLLLGRLHILNNKNFIIDNDKDINKEIKVALEKLSKEENMSEVITKINTEKKVISLTFQGLSDIKTNRKVLDLINQYNHKVDFFIPGAVAVEDSDFIKKIHAKGHKIGSNTLLGSKNMEKYSQEDLIDNFIQTNNIFKKIIKDKPTTLMCNSTVYTVPLLRAAYVSGNKKVVQPTEILSYQSFQDYEQVINYVKKLERGSIITIKMDGVLEEAEYNKTSKTSKSVTNIKDNINKKEDKLEGLTPEEKLINIVDWMLKAIDETDYKVIIVEDLKKYESLDANTEDINMKIQDKGKTHHITLNKELTNEAYFKGFYDKLKLDELRKNNNGKKANEYSTIYTTEKALSYTFYGIENQKVLYKVLKNLDILDAKATFYVNIKDIVQRPNIIKKISHRGHEIGISLIENRNKDFYSTLNDIIFIQKEVKSLTGQTPNLVRYPYYLELKDEILEAVSAANCLVVWQDISIANSNVGVDGSLEDIMVNTFTEGNIVVRRGYIIYYRMDYYKNSYIIPESMIQIARDRIDTVAYYDDEIDNNSNYNIKTLKEVINGHKVYSYPVKIKNILPEVKDAIYPGHLLGYSESDKLNIIKNRYIGNPNINQISTLPGFSEEELKEVDKDGVFTNDKVLFLTFDDWASDKSINQLLYVLKKHNVKGSFFIRTNYIENNPNLLRAIGEEGHDVGSHTNNHLPFAINNENQGEDDTSLVYYSPSIEQILERKEDLLISYNKLQSIIGDVYIDNRPALNTIFRPPTLAMSKAGMEAIFDMGFSYIVSGNFSTHDYEYRDPEILAKKLTESIITEHGNTGENKDGSILVMHMSDFKQNSLYTPNVTAKALDIAIPILKAKGYTFARLSDYLK